MTRQPLVARHAEELLGSSVVAIAPVAGGDVCVATKLRLSDGTTALMKTLNNAPDGFFAAEADGLRWLAAGHGLSVPEVLAGDDGCLILRWVEPGRPSADAASAFGRALATTHQAGAASYGGERDGFIARLPLLNQAGQRDKTWAEFYGQRRLLPYLKLAQDRGRISAGEAAYVESVVARLADLVPEESPARLHGDLWNGNVLWGTEQRVWVIDPAAHGGHRETDLAMLALFGLPHLPRVVDAYEEVSPLAADWQDRVGVHQLFPLLVHACLFGGGYGARAGAAAARYA
ncbi:MAG: fructosamine kinase family protein [Nocardioides sp.]